jgi:hypothetical protein
MRKDEEIMRLMEILRIADKHTIGKIMAARGHWTEGTSANNNAYKALSDLTDLRRIEKCKGYFRVPGCESEYQEHARLITQALSEILIKFPDSVIYREHTISEVGLRPDALVLITQGKKGCCIILEVVNHESEESLIEKWHVWEHWARAGVYLSELFGTRIQHFDFVRHDQLNRYLEEINNERTSHR